MKKVKLLLVALVLMFSFAISANATYSESETNNSYGDADYITPGDTVFGTINNNDDNDYYKMVPSANGKITVSFSHAYQNNSRGWLIYIYKYDDGEYKELSCTGVALNANETITVPFIGAVEGEAYYIRVVKDYYNDIVGVRYTIKTSFTKSDLYEKEVNNSYDKATSVALGNAYVGVINNGNDNDYYKIVPSENGKISLSFVHNYRDNGRGWIVYVYKFDDGEYKELSCTYISLNDSETINLPFVGAVKGQFYYVRVVKDYYNDIVGIQYTLKTAFEQSDYYEKEVNNSADKTTSVTLNKSCTGVINNGNDSDYYKIVPSANGKISVSFTHKYVNNGRGWLVYLYKYDDGQYVELSCTGISMNTKEAVDLPFIGAVKNQNYYIKVVKDYYNDVVGVEYTLKLSFTESNYYEKEVNNSSDKTTSVTLNKSYTGVINNGNDSDYYKIVPSANGKISISFTHKYINNGRGWLVYLYKYDDGQYIELSCTGIAMNTKEAVYLPFIGAVKGQEYYIKVVKDYYNDVVGVEYTLKTSFAESNYYEKEVNNSSDKTTSIKLNKSYTGVINNGSDSDYYKIVPSANGKISISFTHKYINNGRGWLVYLYKYDDGQYIELSCTGIAMNTKEAVSLPFIGAVKGQEYYIKVVKDYYNDVVGVEYTLKTSFTESALFEKEVNNSYDRATSVILNKSYTGVINNGSDNDYYKIVPTSNGKISVSFIHKYSDNGRAWLVYIYKYEQGQYVELSKKSISMNSNETISLPFIGAVKNQTYYVRVVKDYYDDVVGKSYTLKIGFNKSNYTEKEFNESYKTATTAIAGKTYSGVINHSGDYDYYKVTSPGKGTLTISFNHKIKDNGRGWRIEVYTYSYGEYVRLSQTYVNLNSAKTVKLPGIGASKGTVYYVYVTNEYWDDAVGHGYSLDFNFRLSSPTKLKYKSTVSTVSLSWNKVSTATGYKVYQYNTKTKKYVEIASTKDTSYKVSNLKSGTKYKYAVRAYTKVNDVTYYSSYVYITTATTPAQVTGLTVKSAKTKTATVSYSKVNGASGYQIYYSTSKNGTYKQLTTTTKTSYTNAKLTRGKTYYVKVRAYTKVDGKTVYGQFSSTKSVKIK